MKEQSYYDRYMRQSWIFQAVGIVLIVTAAGINELSGRSFALPVWIIAGLGIVPLVIGGASSRPHTVVKSFAILLQNDPSSVNAREFLTAIRKAGKVRLVKRSKTIIESALYAYGQSEEADEELLKELREAIDNNVKVRAF